MTLTDQLLGWRTLKTEAVYAASLLEVCRVACLPYSQLSALPDGAIRMRMRLPVARRMMKLCQSREIPVEWGDIHGIPALLRRLGARPGVVIGMGLGVILLVLSSQVVWDIRVSGNQTLSARDVKETLSACGFTVGTPLRGFAADVTENRALMYDRRLAWISVNRRGCVAYVQIREAVLPPADETLTPANLVAARAGIIQRVELVRGNLLVSAGQSVDEGQLLVSGLYDSEQVGFRWTHAEGQVYARTVREFLIEIPLVYQQDTPVLPSVADQEGVFCEKSLIFFGKTIKFSKKTGNEGGICDTIESEKNLSLIPGVGFPISLRTVWYLPPCDTGGMLTRTPAEAEEMAYLELSRRIADIPGGAELIRKTVMPTLTEDVFRLQVTLVCVEDIAREAEFRVED